MSTKFFSLISNTPVHLGQGRKIIPRDAFSELISSKELLDRIKKEAEEYRKKIIQECETIKEAAHKEGFAAGFQEWTAQIAKLEEEIHNARAETQKLVMPVALKAAQKIVGSEIAMSEQAVFEIVANTLKAVSQHKKITIYVNKKDMGALENNKNKIKTLFENLESLNIRDREDIEPGGCIVETEVGIINAQLKDRWRTLEAAFEAMASTLQRNL